MCISLYYCVQQTPPPLVYRNKHSNEFFFLPRCFHTWELAPAEFPQFLNLGQSVGLLGRVISSSQGLYLYTNTE
jgi:hypothetical protein